MRMINLSLNELKLTAKSRSVQDYRNKSEEDLIKILCEPKPKISLSKKENKRHRFSKSKQTSLEEVFII